MQINNPGSTTTALVTSCSANYVAVLYDGVTARIHAYSSGVSSANLKSYTGIAPALRIMFIGETEFVKVNKEGSLFKFYWSNTTSITTEKPIELKKDTQLTLSGTPNLKFSRYSTNSLLITDS